MASIWNAEGVIDFLKERFSAGDSAADIAAKINTAWACNISRSSVLGKLHRMGLVRSPATVRHTMRTGARMKAKLDRRAKKKATPAQQPTARQSALAAVLERAPREPVPVADNPADFPDRVKIEDLTPRSCRWIYGEVKNPDYGYCGKPTVLGQSWCEHHCRRVFQPPAVSHREAPPARVLTKADLEEIA